MAHRQILRTDCLGNGEDIPHRRAHDDKDTVLTMIVLIQ